MDVLWSGAFFIFGWDLLQIFARIHMTNFLEKLRRNAGNGQHRIRPHRRALRRATVGKAFGTALGCVLIAVSPHHLASVVLVGLALCCLLVADNAPRDFGSDKA